VDILRSSCFIAGRSLADPLRRRQFSSNAKRFFTYKAVVVMRDHLLSGGRSADVLPLIWRWRWVLARYGMGYIHLLGRPFALDVLPATATNWIRRFKRMIGRRKLTITVAFDSTPLSGNSAGLGAGATRLPTGPNERTRRTVAMYVGPAEGADPLGAEIGSQQNATNSPEKIVQR